MVKVKEMVPMGYMEKTGGCNRDPSPPFHWSLNTYVKQVNTERDSLEEATLPHNGQKVEFLLRERKKKKKTWPKTTP